MTSPLQHIRLAPHAFVCLASLLALGCGGGQGQQGGSEGITPEAGLSFGRVPGLGGVQVMVLPVQEVRGVPSSMRPEAEVVYALEQRGSEVRWILPDQLRRTAARSPGVELPVENLPVGAFLRVEVERVGDPLYGHLRRLGAITGADVALLPIRIRFRPEAGEASPAIEIAAALINVRNGWVYWFGIVEGASGPADDPGTLASAADALARRLSPR